MDGDASRSSFIVQACFGYPGSFVSPCEIENCSFKVCEKMCWDFDGDCIESVLLFGKIAIFTMLILPIQEHGRSFHFLVCSLISFFRNSKFF
ncbi:hypothetical protein I79_006140 [Cricetulus griseus]|uniref:Uncharacterized protein n=1 Tax=Cricetulus griseus TaxID=10029 RepID=G3H715_CRIGR|nr:hypothetical protein I79_006140 [Cricetulus griseus]